MMHPALRSYLQGRSLDEIDTGLLSYLANLSKVAEVSPQVAAGIVQELVDQRSHLKLIASENYSSLSAQAAMANLLTDKYAEGFVGHRFYAGCDNVDTLERIACEEACALFGSEHAYVQPHSGADANLVAFWAILHQRVGSKALERMGSAKLGDLSDQQWREFRAELGNQRLLALDYYSGGHLTHGYRFNVSAQMFDVYSYAVERETGILDYDRIERQAREVAPLILLAGYSAYPRKIDFKRMRQIADSVGAVLMVDMAHFAGLVAGGVFEGDFNPIPHAHVVTTTTHKTLRGPRGGMVLSTKEFADQVDKGCPYVLGGPLPHVMAAKAISFMEARRPAFREYAQNIVKNSRALAAACVEEGLKVATNGTDNHIVLLDVTPFGLNGRQAEAAVRSCGITLNRNSLPYDPNGPWFTSGLRLGTPALTTLGMGEAEMRTIGSLFKEILSNTSPARLESGEMSRSKFVLDETIRSSSTEKVHDLLRTFALYPELDLDILRQFLI